MSSKKAQMGSTFKYIFILIVGALFLMFFVRFAMQYMNTADTVDTMQWLINLEDRLSAIGATPNTLNYDSLNKPMDVRINEGRISSGKITRSTKKIIFSLSEMKTKKPYLWSLRWSYPYEIASFYYIFPSNVKVYVVYPSGDSDLEDYLKTELIGTPKESSAVPEELLKKGVVNLISDTDFKKSKNIALIKKMASSNQMNKFIFVWMNQGDSSKMKNLRSKVKNVKNSKIVFVSIVKDDFYDNLVYGKVECEGKESMFLGAPMFYGVMFSDDFDNYEFNVNRALERLGQITKIYSSKANLLNSKKPSCGYLLFKNNILSGYINLVSGDVKDPKQYFEKASALIDENEQFGGDCPNVF